MLDLQDINYQPTIEEISDYIGVPLFTELYQHMNAQYKALCKIEYSKDVWFKGWNVKFRKAGKSLCVVYPRESHFLILVVVSSKEKEKVENLLPELSKSMQDIYYQTQEGMGQR